MGNTISRCKELFWPTIVDVESSRKASRFGFWVAVYFAASISAIGLLSRIGYIGFDFDDWALIDALLFFLIAFGIDRLSRIASIFGFALYFIEKVILSSGHGYKGFVVTAMFFFAFMNAVRASFAYHSYLTPNSRSKSLKGRKRI
jgi:hypothetical protein